MALQLFAGTTKGCGYVVHKLGQNPLVQSDCRILCSLISLEGIAWR